jgi:hypothetical protein
MLKSLERIEKKLEKESDSSKKESLRTPERKRRSRSVSRHRRRSPKHSIRETHNSSSPSPTRKHKRYGMDELKGEMNKIKPPTFDGEHKKEEDDETWLLDMRKSFQLQNYSSHAEGRISIHQLKGKHPCGGINLCRCNTSGKGTSHGKNSRGISRGNT